MLEGTYAVKVDTPLGKQEGTVELVPAGDGLHVTVKAPIIGTQKGTAAVDGDRFTLSGSATILFQRFDYTIDGRVEGDMLKAAVSTGKGAMQIEGTRVKAAGAR